MFEFLHHAHHKSLAWCFASQGLSTWLCFFEWIIEYTIETQQAGGRNYQRRKINLGFLSLCLIYFISWHTDFEVFKENVPFVGWALGWGVELRAKPMQNIMKFNICIERRDLHSGVLFILVRLSNVSVQSNGGGGGWLSHLKKCLSPRCSRLQHDREDGEDDDLNGGSASIPVWPADPVLRIKSITIL